MNEFRHTYRTLDFKAQVFHFSKVNSNDVMLSATPWLKLRLPHESGLIEGESSEASVLEMGRADFRAGKNTTHEIHYIKN